MGKKFKASRIVETDLSFDDFAGADAAKEEVQELVSMLKNPAVYAAAGARLPKGVLMEVQRCSSCLKAALSFHLRHADIPFFQPISGT